MKTVTPAHYELVEDSGGTVFFFRTAEWFVPVEPILSLFLTRGSYFPTIDFLRSPLLWVITSLQRSKIRLWPVIAILCYWAVSKGLLFHHTAVQRHVYY